MAVDTIDVHGLPTFPSLKTLRSLPPSTRTSVLDKILKTLQQTITLSDERLSNAARSACLFISSYARDGSLDLLDRAVFPTESNTGRTPGVEKAIRNCTLVLAERLVSLKPSPTFDVQTLLDLTVVYGQKNTTRLQRFLSLAAKARLSLLDEMKVDAVPSFARLLVSRSLGLHAIRKTLLCLVSFLQCAPPDIVRIFAQSKEFSLGIAKCYDERLSAIAASYGGINVDASDDPDTKLWLECKVACIDILHIILQRIILDVQADPRTQGEHAIGIVFALVGHSQSVPAGNTPFLNRPLLADYQQVYSLSSSLTSYLSGEDDPRLDVLDAALKSFDANGSQSVGALKILVRSSGPSRISASSHVSRPSTKGKERAEPTSVSYEDEVRIQMAVSNVTAILPDYDESYIKDLLQLPQYSGDDGFEHIIAALLEGDAPSPDAARASVAERQLIFAPDNSAQTKDDGNATSTRNNEWAEQAWDIKNVTIGKRDIADQSDLMNDRSYFSEQMKADILRRAAELSDSEEEEAEVDEQGRKVKIVAFEDEDEDLAAPVKVLAGDEDDSDERASVASEKGDDEPVARNPETILELAYIQSPKVFDRDSDTRRSRARADLKTRTGWGDEQIEGWKIMLERDPKKKEKMLQKYEFSGNRTPDNGTEDSRPSSSQGGASSDSRARGGWRGRGRGRGGRGRGAPGGASGSGGGGGGGGEARDRAWKDKNKARQANHNRKRGHDKKMARGGGPA